MAHQREGVGFLLARRAALLAFEQGLGKTLVAIEAFRELRLKGALDAMLVLCPNSLKRTWATEAAKFAPELRVHVVTGAARARRRGIGEAAADVVVVNYEAARNEVTALRALLQRRRCALVLDESHNVKNYRSLNAVAARHLAPLAEYRWLLTGTPATNTPLDLYSQLTLVAGEKQPFGSLAAFQARYGDDAHPGDVAALAEKAAPFLLRRTKEQCLDLPDKTFIDVSVELQPWQRKLYDAMRDDLAHDVEGMSPEQFRAFVPTAMTRLLRLSQVASNPALLLPSERRVPAKFTELDRFVEEIVSAERKVIVWSYYVETIQALAGRYRELGAAALYGETPAEDRQALAARFQSDPGLRILVANPGAAGTGFTLTAASYAIYETLSWRYDLYAQSQDRNHRIGQRNPVTYIRLLADDTVEQAIVQALERKARMAAGLLGDKVDGDPVPDMTAESFLHLLRTGTLPD